MKRSLLLAVTLGLLVQLPALAVDNKYRQKLERSGCTQVSELQGCDINKTKAENVKAGLAADAPDHNVASGEKAGSSPYAGNWIALGTDGSATVAKIHIDSRNKVTVNGKAVKAKLSDGALVFKQGWITYTIQGDRRVKGEDHWFDSDAMTKGSIRAE